MTGWPLAISAEGDATWWDRAHHPSADDALAGHEALEGSPPGDELLNAEGAGRRVRIVWMRRALLGDLDAGIALEEAARWWVPCSPDRAGAVECWEVV